MIESGDNTHLIVYLLDGAGGGDANTESPCEPEPKKKWVVGGGKLKSHYNIIMFARVSCFTGEKMILKSKTIM